MTTIPPRPASLPTGAWTEAAARVLHERYTLKDEQGRSLESPDDVFWRVAYAVARTDRAFGADDAAIEAIARRFYTRMARGEFMPNSPVLMNAGKDNGLQYAACFVLPVQDDLSGIFMAIHNAALVHQSGGGTGMAFSRLRPRGSRVRTTSGVSSGPVSFLRVFDAATQHVKQGASRRGANMAILRVDHPDILEFINCKRDGGITNFNISVAITDALMDALAHGRTYALRAQPGWPLPHGGRARGGESLGELDAREVWRAICEAAWATGDPGLFFVDRVNASPANAVPALQQIESTNPCGEQSLPPHGVCTLGHLNLAAFVRDGAIDYGELSEAARDGVHFLDNVVEVNPYTLEEIREQAHNERRIGLGVMGWADLLFALNIPYASAEAVTLARELGAFIRSTAVSASQALATQRGPFPWFHESIYRDGTPRRNSNCTTVAPTGTVSIFAGCSSGIEPLFALAFQHRVKQPDGVRVLTFVNSAVRQALAARGLDRPEILEALERQGTLHGIPGVPEDLQAVYTTAHEVPVEWHVQHQAAWQTFSDSSVSKCVAGDTLLVTDRGTLPIKALHEERGDDQFADLDITVAGERGPATTSAFYSGGLRPTITIDLDHGTTLTATPNHRIRVMTAAGRVWKRLDQLAPGDVVVVQVGQQLYPKHQLVSPAFARLLGHLIADGNIQNDFVSMCHRSPEVNQDRAALLTLPEVNAATERMRDTWKRGRPVRIVDDRRKPGLLTVVRSGRGLVGFLETTLGLRRRAANKHVPPAVLQSDWAVQREFLRGLFTDCGVAALRKDPTIQFNTASPQLAREVRAMLMNAGIYSNLTHLSARNGRRYLRLHLGPRDAMRFATTIGFIEPERTRQFARWAALRWYARDPDFERVEIERVKRISHGTARVFDVSVPDGHAYIANGIVSHNTINLPNAASVEDVARAYQMAWDTGCLGITVFRDGCKGEQVLNVGTASAPTSAAAPVESLKPLVEPRPRRIRGETWEVASPLGEVYITLNVTEAEEPFEIFLRVGKSGSDIEAFAEALGRLMSNFLRYNRLPDRRTRLAKIVKQLTGIGGANQVGFGANRVRSVPDAVAKALGEFLRPDEAEQMGLFNGGAAAAPTVDTRVGDMCPKCGNATFIYEEGCHKCHSCGHSEC